MVLMSITIAHIALVIMTFTLVAHVMTWITLAAWIFWPLIGISIIILIGLAVFWLVISNINII